MPSRNDELLFIYLATSLLSQAPDIGYLIFATSGTTCLQIQFQKDANNNNRLMSSECVHY